MNSKLVIKSYQPKSILNVHKHVDGGWFWVKYSAFPYLGCQYGCEYCYWRDEKYNPHKPSRDLEVLKFEDAFSQYIKIKENAVELLSNELSKKPKDLIYLDHYQPLEAKERLTRGMLEVCLESGFPVFINEKSPLVLNDLDILKKISKKTYLTVAWSIVTTVDDKTRIIFEPKAPSVKARFEAMKKLSEAGISTGTVFMPILPFIYDDEKNIEAVIKKTKECGGEYILEGGLTLWGHCKTHFYKILEKHDPKLLAKYKMLYDKKDNKQDPWLTHTIKIHSLVKKYCQKYGIKNCIPRPVNFFPKYLQGNKKIAADFFLQAREIQLSSGMNYKYWAFQKAAWAIDELNQDTREIYKKQGKKGLLAIKGVGESIAEMIIEFLRTGKCEKFEKLERSSKL